MPRTPDLSPIEFRHALLDHGFAYLGAAVDLYVDLRFPKPGHYLASVRDSRRRILRRETLDALLADRATSETAKKAADAVRMRQEKIAATIAPVALPPIRANLADAAAVAQLADDFVMQSTRSDGVVFADLKLMGWRDEQIRQHSPAARILAYRRQETVLA